MATAPDSIPSLIAQTAGRFPDRIALRQREGQSWREISYRQMLGQVVAVRQLLSSRYGIQLGDRVLLYSENCAAWVIWDLAIQVAGAATVPLHVSYGPENLGYVIREADVKLLVVGSAELLAKVQATGVAVPATVICWEQLTSASPSVHYEKPYPEPVGNWPVSAASGGELATIIYTSGTTGEPKGVQLTHANLLANVTALLQSIPLTEQDHLLTILPLSHVLVRTCGTFTPLAAGACLSFGGGIKDVAADLQAVRPTIFLAVPRLFDRFHEKILAKLRQGGALRLKLFYWALRQRSALRKKPCSLWRKLTAGIADRLVLSKVLAAFGGRLRFAVSGGASLHDRPARFLEDVGVQVLEGYGLTETSPVLTVNRLGRHRWGTVGQALPNVKLRLSADGEVEASGPSVFRQYWRQEAETRQAFSPDGWFRTGDKGSMSQDGYLTIVGRIKELIIGSNGKNVSPEHIENALNEQPGIAQAMVSYVPGRGIVALVVAEPVVNGISPSDPALVAAVRADLRRAREHLNEEEELAGFLLLPQSFTEENNLLTPTLKLRRPQIRELYASLIVGEWLAV